jgi:hypothetical protein
MCYAVLAHATDNRTDKVYVKDRVGIDEMKGYRHGEKA